jgi:hypothetical protein
MEIRGIELQNDEDKELADSLYFSPTSRYLGKSTYSCNVFALSISNLMQILLGINS